MQLGIKSLGLHKARAALTMLGIIFGVCSVIAMLAIGEGASHQAQESIKELGSANVILRSIKPAIDPMKGSTARSMQYGITYLDLDRIRSVIPGVDQVVPMRIVRETARFGAQNAPCPLREEDVGKLVRQGCGYSKMSSSGAPPQQFGSVAAGVCERIGAAWKRFGSSDK